MKNVDAFIISDIHLSENEPATLAGFLHFLQQQASQADSLYILGDLFEYWIGDDDPNPLHDKILQAFLVLHQQNVNCYFIHGNRDLLLGKKYAKQCKMIVLPSESVINITGRNILLLHGDELCTYDKSYQRYRRLVHCCFIQKLFLRLPLSMRLKFVERLRARSKAENYQKSAQEMDTNPEEVCRLLMRYGVDIMIHGHTHKPAVHQLMAGTKHATRYVLGAWHQEGSLIKITPSSIELLRFPLITTGQTSD